MPQDLLDAAQIDGAGTFYIYSRISLPLTKATTAVISINVLLSAWNEFFWYFVAANRPNLWTINVALYNLSGFNTKQNALMGLAFITIVPAIIITLIFSRKIKGALITSGIKG